MELTPASGFKRRPAASSSTSGVRETARSPPPCSPSLSPSSASSDPSSPLSTSSSVCGNSSVYQNHVKGLTQGTEVARVSSTSASLATQSFSTLAPNTISSKFFPHNSVQPRFDCEEASRKREMYDPFHPTEGVKGEEGEKYDPFDPTGSPASDDDDDDDDGSGKVRGVKRNAERGDDEEKEEEPPDSTEALTDLPSPSLSTQLPLRRRVECSSARAREQRCADSDHSEIEEGEIVGAADRDGGNKRPAGETLPINSPSVSFFGSKPERILRVLDGDGLVSVHTESNWEVDREPEDEPVVGVEDLRRKLVSRRKERYLSFPASSPLSPQPPPPSHPPASTPSSPLIPPIEQGTKNRSKPSKSSKDSDRQKSKDRKAGEKEERRKKSRKDKEGGRERSKEKERGHKAGKEVKGRRSSRSSSRKRKKRHHSSPEASRSCNSSGRGGHTRQPFSSLPEERPRQKEREKESDRGRERDRDREQNRTSSHRREERERDSSSRKEEKERKGRQHSSSRERGISKRSKESSEKRESDRDRQRERERRRDGRPVVPPSIQDLNGSDLFAIKRTITVTTTTTTTTVPGSPRLTPTSPCRPTQDSDKPHKRKKKRKWHSAGEMDDRGSCHSQSQSISPPRFHSYESDRYSDKLEIDVLSLDGEALDSDYPSLEDTPPAALPPEPPVPSPKTKTTPKTGRHHPKKKSHALKKIDQSSSSSKGKCLSSLTVTSGSAAASSGLPSAKRARKMGKDKDRNKGSRKDLGHSGKSKKESGGSRKAKLQSKVSVLVREGVSSTTGTSVGSGKLGMDLLGPGGTGGGAGGSVVGGSIAVVFCRDNESRSPFLKPCSEPLSLGNRSKDLASTGKRSSLVAPPSSLTSPAGLKSKKTKPSSITSTSSSASSPSSSLATKRRRRLAKKSREKGGAVGLTAEEDSQTKAQSEGWGGVSLDVQSAIGDGSNVLPPSSSPPHTPPPSMAPLRDTRESSPDSQTVDSSCKTPDPSFLAEDCPTQTSPTLPASSPSSLSTPKGAGLSIALSTPTAKPPLPDDAPKSLASPPCSSSSAGCDFTSLSLPLSSSDPSSSVSSSSASKPPPPPPPAAPALPWSLQTGVDCTTGGVLALTALLFKMEEANIASRAKAQEFIQATSQILSQANQSQSQQLAPPSSASSSQIPPPPSLPPPPGLSPAQFILHSSLPLVGCTKTPPSLLHPSIGGGCAQTPPFIIPVGLSGLTGSSSDTGWDNESKDPDKYLKKLHTQERAVEEVKLAIKPYYQRKDINKDDYKDILRKAVHKICHSRTGEINPVKVSNLVKLYVQRYKYFRKHGRRMDEEERDDRELHSSF
ncbi:hypothetical protein VZT92_008241 [Zoarces viviparus]|uniref:SFR19-like C-terminal domain-containing protein n=1 Tax=Zoarces viviparus TaxID=48416 RepID=A0AAW1FM47_ZOAVI